VGRLAHWSHPGGGTSSSGISTAIAWELPARAGSCHASTTTSDRASVAAGSCCGATATAPAVSQRPRAPNGSPQQALPTMPLQPTPPAVPSPPAVPPPRPTLAALPPHPAPAAPHRPPAAARWAMSPAAASRPQPCLASSCSPSPQRSPPPAAPLTNAAGLGWTHPPSAHWLVRGEARLAPPCGHRNKPSSSRLTGTQPLEGQFLTSRKRRRASSSSRSPLTLQARPPLHPQPAVRADAS
jgi:hypothetical protein